MNALPTSLAPLTYKSLFPAVAPSVWSCKKGPTVNAVGNTNQRVDPAPKVAEPASTNLPHVNVELPVPAGD
jgi:hypothetical protein